MRQRLLILIVGCSIMMFSCSEKRSHAIQLAHDDSLRIVNDKIFQRQLSDLQKVRENLIGPSLDGEITVTKGDKFKTNVLDDSTSAITAGFEKLNAKMERAQKDSTTLYGPLFTRFRLLKTQHKYLTATYTDEAHLLRFSSEITFDDKHEEDRDFYFTNGNLAYFRERHTSNQEGQDLMIEDSYFLFDGKVAYAYRDEGKADEVKDRMNVMSLKRFILKGDLTAHVSKEFNSFKKDYDILLTQPLEPLIYPSESKAQ
jgi:hypothetical protein